MSKAKPWLGAVSLALVILSCSRASTSGTAAQPGQAHEVTLTQQSPQAAFPLDQERVKKGMTTVSLQLIRIENPDRANFTVDVKLSECAAGAPTNEIPVGSLGTYPAGEAGGWYALDLGPALKQMNSAGQPLSHTCLKLLLKPLHASTDWRKLRVTVSSPQWRQPREDGH